MEGTSVSELTDAEAAALGQGEGPSLLEQYLADPSHDYKTLKYGDVMDGVIMRIDRDEILVDIGSKSEGIVPAREFSSLTTEERQHLSIGETVLVFVVQPENQEGQAVVSIDRARQEKSWRRLQEIYEANDVIEAEVTNYNKGGLLVNLDGVRGFVPASQVSEIRGGDDASKQADMARLIGTSLPLKVIEINRHRNRLILSERQAVQERRDVMKEKLIEELKEGEVRKGRVSSICDFGAFVDIGGADGLVHLSELSWSRVRHPSELLRIGQEIDVYVLGINAQEKKIALSIKRTQAEPWSQVAAKYEVGQLVRGTVTQLANFGAFARIEDGIEGLIHVSELTDERITHPKQVVKEGDELLLRIIRIDPQRRRMGLSLRRALDTPDAELQAVFGEDVLEERDRIVADIHAALEAEGIEIGSGSRADDEGEREEAASSAGPREAGGDAEVVTAEPSAVDTAPEAPVAAMVDDTVVSETPADDSAAAEAPVEKPKRTRKAPTAKSAPEETAGLSAIELAFAMAGANLELDDDDNESGSEPADANGGEEREE
jgi:small subunit ribosomal protein S1